MYFLLVTVYVDVVYFYSLSLVLIVLICLWKFVHSCQVGIKYRYMTIKGGATGRGLVIVHVHAANCAGNIVTAGS